MGFLPDGWNDYIRTGKRINKTRFIAFKVPLRESANRTDQIAEENKWHPKLLVTLIPDIGMVIDLTNTAKYYNPQDFLELGVDHFKIFVEGHHIPSQKNYKLFRQAVGKFLRDNAGNDKLIGVHCTHGLNRTGFLVCRYMIEEMKMNAEEAISLFEDARGHKIKRENYTNELKCLPKRASSAPRSTDSHSRDDDRSTVRNRRLRRGNQRQNGEPYNRNPTRAAATYNYRGDGHDSRLVSQRLTPNRMSPYGYDHYYYDNRDTQPHHSQRNERNHQYIPSRPSYASARPRDSLREMPRDANDRRSNYSYPNARVDSSRYTWRRDQHHSH